MGLEPKDTHKTTTQQNGEMKQIHGMTMNKQTKVVVYYKEKINRIAHGQSVQKCT